MTAVTFACRFGCSMIERSRGWKLVCALRAAIGEVIMSRSGIVRLLLVCSLAATLFTGCSRDPNVRKQKYFESGERYFARSKYRQAAIQFSNAVQVDPRFAQAHYQLAQTYLKLRDFNRAYQALSRAVELAPHHYPAHRHLSTPLISAPHLH